MLLSLILPLSLAPAAGAARPTASVTLPDRAAETAARAPRYDFSSARELLAEWESTPPGDAPTGATAARARRGERLGGGVVFAGDAARQVARRSVPRLRTAQRPADPVRWECIGSGPLASAFGLTVITVRVAALALPTEYVVDITGAPGSDFTQIHEALVVALAGDLVTVRPGLYEDFDLSRGVTILGDPGSAVQWSWLGGSSIQLVPAGEIAVLAGIDVYDLSILDNAGTVVLDRVGTSDLTVEASVDVRVHRSDQISTGTATVDGSRVEFVGCELHGDDGEYADSYYYQEATDGEHGVFASASLVHVARCEVSGGYGGDGDTDCAACGDPIGCNDLPPGDPAPGIEVESGYVVVTGDGSQTIEGGRGGYYPCWGYDPGAPGLLIQGRGFARESGVTIENGGPSAFYPDIQNDGFLEQPAVDDPTLQLVGNPVPGETLRFVVRGNPGGAARLYFSRTPIVEPVLSPTITRLIPFTKGVDLENLPASGRAVYRWTVPPRPGPSSGPVFAATLGQASGPLRGLHPRGTLFFAQATVFTAGTNLKTNSVPVLIR